MMPITRCWSLPAISDAGERIPIGANEFYHRQAGEALHPAHESRETLHKLQQILGSYVFATQESHSRLDSERVFQQTAAIFGITVL